MRQFVNFAVILRRNGNVDTTDVFDTETKSSPRMAVLNTRPFAGRNNPMMVHHDMVGMTRFGSMSKTSLTSGPVPVMVGLLIGKGNQNVRSKMLGTLGTQSLQLKWRPREHFGINGCGGNETYVRRCWARCQQWPIGCFV